MIELVLILSDQIPEEVGEIVILRIMITKTEENDADVVLLGEDVEINNL